MGLKLENFLLSYFLSHFSFRTYLY